MFGRMKRKMFAAKVMAEIKAQTGNQEFVDRLFSTDWTEEQLEHLRKHAYYRKDSAASFLYGCHMLHQGMLDDGFDTEMRAACCYFLTDRLRKANTNPQFWQQHILIFGNLNDAVMQFSEQLQS
ncbi:hypothetical protein [Magnetovibrio sp.]|uniref:hypothetical protein n=1 Tax=Magnetovibrio sp. TaxID=2024836 RepID=UPI002F9413EE